MQFRYLPNLLSLSRIIIAPIFALFMLKNSLLYKLISLLLFFIGSLSDALDGYFARKYNNVSNLGKYLDPLADKVLVLSAFVIFAFHYQNIVQIWMLVVFVLRDVFVMLFRNFLILNNKVLSTSLFAKFKTIFQIIVLHIFLVFHIYNPKYIYDYNFCYFLMLLCVLLSIVSTYSYIRILIKDESK
tara:strand:+ start:2426 stop:2983 length:558 start_codon:yes stop_codon:yes gene_type:complete